MIKEKFKQFKEAVCAFAKYYFANVEAKMGSDDASVAIAAAGI